MYSAGGGYNVAVLRPRRLAGRTDYQQSRHLTPPIAPTLLLVHASLNYSTHSRMSMETCGAQWWEPRKTETWRCLNCQDDKDGVTVYLYFSSAVASPTSCGPHAQVSPREEKKLEERQILFLKISIFLQKCPILICLWFCRFCLFPSSFCLCPFWLFSVYVNM